MQSNLLSSMYESKFNIDFNMLLTQMKFNILTQEIKDYIRDTFDCVISNNNEFKEMYENVVVPDNLKKFDIKGRKIQPRRLTLKYLEEKENTIGLTENERMVKQGIFLKQLSTRIHNMGKHGKCTDEEARAIISGIQTMFKKSKNILDKYGRKNEWNFEE